MSVALEIMGDQRPRLSHLPLKVGSAGPAAFALAEMAGLTLDPWQMWCTEQILGERDDFYFNEIKQMYMPKSSAYETGLVVARQNGKGAILEACELAWLFLLGASTILHSAHEFPTAREHFMRIEGLVTGTPELNAELARGGIKWSHGDESINLANGQRLIFKARTKGAARGFSIDKLVMDEAMILADAGVKAMTFATSARPDPQIIMSGSVGNRDSVHFGRARRRGIKGNDPRLFFAEWSPELHTPFCSRDCREHDERASPETWAKANPGLGIRLQLENVRSEFLGLSEEAFNEERLSVGDWPADGEAWGVITEEAWLNCFDPMSKPMPHMTFSIDTTPDKRWSSIVVAAANGESGVHVEVTGNGRMSDYRSGTSWVTQRAIEINKNHRNSLWVVDKSTQAGTYWDELETAGLKLITPTVREHAQACGAFFSSVMPIGGSKPDIRHSNQPELSSAVAQASKRNVAEIWAWDLRELAGDISCLVAATNAVWGHRKRVHKPPPKPMAMWG